MINIYIDKTLLDIDQNTNVSINIGIGSVSTPGENSTAFTKAIKIPMTPHNRKIMDHTEQIYNKELFNTGKVNDKGITEPHLASIDVDGFVVMTGVAQLKSVTTYDNGEGYYEINFIGEEYKWVALTKNNLLSDIPLSKDLELSKDLIVSQMTDTQNLSLRFIPVNKGGLFRAGYVSKDQLIPRDIIEIQDLIPFVHLRSIIEKIFKACKYSVVSSFMNTPEFNSLYFSGEWLQQDTSDMVDLQGFCAGSSQKEINISPADLFTIYNQLGGKYVITEKDLAKKVEHTNNKYALVNTTNNVGDDNDLYNNGSCFKYDAENHTSQYTASNDCNVSFVYDIYYKSGFGSKFSSLGNKFEFAYFDTISLFGRNYVIPCDLSNEYDNLNGHLQSNKRYLIQKEPEGFVYGWDVVCVNSSNHNDILNNLGSFPNSKMISFTTPNDDRYNNATICYYRPGQLLYANIIVIEFPSVADFHARIVTEPIYAEKGAQILLDTPTFSVSNTGIPISEYGFSLKEFSIVEAQFYDYPGFGKTLKSTDIVNSEQTQMDLISGIRQLFNLYFYTNNITREVHIEPIGSFYGNDVVDWSNKVDYSREILIEDMIEHSKVKLSYSDCDDAVLEYNEQHKTELGNYTISIKNSYVSDEDVFEVQNPLLAVSVIKPVDNWAKMNAIDVAGNIEPTLMDDMEINISPRIIQTISSANATNVPLFGTYTIDSPIEARFIDPLKNINLGFSDTEQTKGLNQYYHKNILNFNQGKRITAYLKLEPHDIEPLLYPDNDAEDLRSLFNIRINGEDVLCRIENIVDYNPASADSTKCVFIKEIMEIEPTVSFSVPSLNVGYEANGFPVTIKSNSNWEITSTTEWISVTPMHGVGDAEVIISVPENVIDVRNGLIEVTAFNLDQSAKETLNVTQAPCAFTASTTEFTLEPGHMTQTINLGGVFEHGFSLNLADIPDYIDVLPQYGANTITVTFSNVFYGGTSLFTITRNTFEDTIEITVHANKEPVLEILPSEINVAASGKNGRFRLRANYETSIISDADWVITAPSSPPTSTSWVYIYFTCSANTGVQRTCNLTLTSHGLKEWLVITQAAGSIANTADLWYDMDDVTGNPDKIYSKVGNKNLPLIMNNPNAIDFPSKFLGPTSYATDPYGRYANFTGGNSQTTVAGCMVDLQMYNGSPFTFVIRQNISNLPAYVSSGGYVFYNCSTRTDINGSDYRNLVLQRWETSPSSLLWSRGIMCTQNTDLNILGYQTLIIRSNGIDKVDMYQNLQLNTSIEQVQTIGKSRWNNRDIYNYMLYIQPWGGGAFSAKLYDFVFFKRCLSDAEMTNVHNELTGATTLASIVNTDVNMNPESENKYALPLNNDSAIEDDNFSITQNEASIFEPDVVSVISKEEKE